MNLFKNFNKTFFSITKPKIEWFDKLGVMKTDDPNIIVEFRLGIHDSMSEKQFYGYRVTIKNILVGVISEHFFPFDQYLIMTQRDKGQQRCYVWYDNNEVDWYIDTPTNSRPMIMEMLKYVEQYVSLKIKRL